MFMRTKTTSNRSPKYKNTKRMEISNRIERLRTNIAIPHTTPTLASDQR